MKRCPICNGPLGDRPALSRRDNKTDICAECGVKEAIEDRQNFLRMRMMLNKKLMPPAKKGAN